MSSSQSSTNDSLGFWIVTSVVMMLGAGFLAFLWPAALRAARVRSDQLVQAAKSAPSSEARLDLQLAQLLNPSNKLAAASVAAGFIANGQPERAIQVLDWAGGAGERPGLLALYTRAYLETGDTVRATQAADQLSARATTQADLLLSGLAYGVGDQPDKQAALMPRITAPEATRRALAAQTDKLALARELYTTGLVNSSNRLLTKQPASYTRDFMLAQLEYTAGTKSDLAQAESHAANASSLNPADRPARHLLIQILQAERKTAEADQQKLLLDKLTAGRP